MPFHTLLNYKVILMLLVLFITLLLQGCAGHSSEAMDKSALRFYGTPSDNGDDFIHEQAPNSVFSEGLNCSQFKNMGAALNYRTDKVINLSSSNIGCDW